MDCVGASVNALRNPHRWQQTFPHCCEAGPDQDLDRGKAHFAAKRPFSVPFLQQPHPILERCQVRIHSQSFQTWWRVASFGALCWIPDTMMTMERCHLETAAWGIWENTCATRFQAEEAALQQAGFDHAGLTTQPRFDKGLTTQAAVMEYVQDHGTEQMQLFVHQRQRHLKDFVAEAMQWGSARQQAAAERQGECSTLCGRYIVYTCPNLWQRCSSKCCGMDCVGTYFTHARAQTCDTIQKKGRISRII